MLDLQRGRFTFFKSKGKEQSQSQRFTFASPVRIVDAAISAFDIGFVDSDHEFGRTLIAVGAFPFSSTEFDVVVSFQLRDLSGFFDNFYSGFVEVLVIADRA
jgi:hypothetical protein